MKNISKYFYFIFFINFFLGCASINYSKDKFWYRKEEGFARKEILRCAYKIKSKDPSYEEKMKIYDPVKDEKIPYIIDCSGFVRAAYTMAGITELEERISKISGASNVVRIWHVLKAQNRIYNKNVKPNKGDLVFFDNTYDRNGNGKVDDTLTHVGIVEKVDGKGTITFIHSSTKRGVIFSLANPHYSNKEKINMQLRKETNKDPKGTKYYSGGLINSFGTIFKVPSK
ncbi:MAG: CHAP domain-containing protein [Elusimicrobia bacterium]|nr:CHAP domain-containing protein [Elusimicrobiota bacterium]